MVKVKAVNRTKEAIEELFAQQRLDGTQGIEVRLSNQNQVFLNTWRPTRAPISAEMLEQLVPGFKRGSTTFLTIASFETGVTSYNHYVGGRVWVPTVHSGMGKPDDVFHASIQPLTPEVFLDKFPALMYSNDAYLMRWMPDDILLRVSREAASFTLLIEQWPAIRGFNEGIVPCNLSGGLVHQTGSIILPFTITDAFSVERKMRLYHNGHESAKLALFCAGDYFRVVHISYDGFKVRFVYEYTLGERASTSVYLKPPSTLYRLGELNEIDNRYHFNGIRRLYIIEDVQVIDEHERTMVERGRSYPVGRVGAEIAYSVITQKFGHTNLVLEEPGRAGRDLYTTDGKVAVQARLTRRIPRSMELLVESEIRQMSAKLQMDFPYTPQAKVGYAVLSLHEWGRIQSLIAEVEPFRS